uniref:Uncharacterized protein n=1 Tax=Sipha flava TaxID=143950 RepID=A0A2S2R258_9HEMI
MYSLRYQLLQSYLTTDWRNDIHNRISNTVQLFSVAAALITRRHVGRVIVRRYGALEFGGGGTDHSAQTGWPRDASTTDDTTIHLLWTARQYIAYGRQLTHRKARFTHY